MSAFPRFSLSHDGFFPFDVRRWTFDVRCSMFKVLLLLQPSAIETEVASSHSMFDVGRSMFDVRGSMFDVQGFTSPPACRD
jgi:hypothetical protein